MLCAAAPPSGGRFPLTPRFMRHFHILCMPNASPEIMENIFEQIVCGFLSEYSFADQVQKCGSISVAATIEVYNQVTIGLLPTPAKFHYTFNLRDISKVFQGILMTRPKGVSDAERFTNLWIHETCRVFSDRLTNDEDREFFKDRVVEMIDHKFKEKRSKEQIFVESPILFSNLMRIGQDEELYE